MKTLSPRKDDEPYIINIPGDLRFITIDPAKEGYAAGFSHMPILRCVKSCGGLVWCVSHQEDGTLPLSLPIPQSELKTVHYVIPEDERSYAYLERIGDTNRWIKRTIDPLAQS